MKNISLILNGVLAVAVAILFYLQLSQSPNAKSADPASPVDLKIAYIKSDTILKHYEYFKVNRDRLETKGKKLNQDFNTRAQTLQNDYEAYQRNLGNLTIGQAKAIEEDLAKKQENLRIYQESLSQELSNDQAKMSQELYGKVTDFLKKYGEDKGIQLVLKYDPTSDVLFGGAALDITTDVLTGLNEAYQQEKLSAPVKKDSTATKKK